MMKLFVKLQTLASQDRGATAVEYALLVGLIAVAIIGTVTALGGQINSLFTTVKNALANI
jgi:pilus assembly protein Flp/PilA